MRAKQATKKSRRDLSSRERQASKVLAVGEAWQILYWRQVISAMALITFMHEGYYFLAVILVRALEADRKDILPGLE